MVYAKGGVDMAEELSIGGRGGASEFLEGLEEGIGVYDKKCGVA